MATGYTTLGDSLQIDVSTTLTTVPGVQSITLNPGENTTAETGGLEDDFDTIIGTGVQSGGTISGSMVWDPLNSVQQTMAGYFNSGAVIDGNYIAETGTADVNIAVSAVLTKFEIKSERKNVKMVDFELKLADRVTLPTTTPT